MNIRWMQTLMRLTNLQHQHRKFVAYCWKYQVNSSAAFEFSMSSIYLKDSLSSGAGLFHLYRTQLPVSSRRCMPSRIAATLPAVQAQLSLAVLALNSSSASQLGLALGQPLLQLCKGMATHTDEPAQAAAIHSEQCFMMVIMIALPIVHANAHHHR